MTLTYRPKLVYKKAQDIYPAAVLGRP